MGMRFKEGGSMLKDPIGFTIEDLMYIVKFPTTICDFKMAKYAVYRQKVDGLWMEVLAKETEDGKLEVVDWSYEQGMVYPSDMEML